jgi:23S rRNA (adenine2503-C2)-methyltransferase
MNKTDLANLSLEQLTGFLVGLGLPKYRAIQVFTWLYRPHFTGFSQMTDLPKALRENLGLLAGINWPLIQKLERSSDGTVKFGFKLRDNRYIEAVLIPEEDRNTLCVSSQVGCAMGCEFCLTGTSGFKRNLSPGEIVGQVVRARDWLLDRPETSAGLNNLVFMGIFSWNRGAWIFLSAGSLYQPVGWCRRSWNSGRKQGLISRFPFILLKMQSVQN